MPTLITVFVLITLWHECSSFGNETRSVLDCFQLFDHLGNTPFYLNTLTERPSASKFNGAQVSLFEKILGSSLSCKKKMNMGFPSKHGLSRGTQITNILMEISENVNTFQPCKRVYIWWLQL
jgi:hypothetical protein